MTVSVNKVGKGSYNIDRVACNDNHLLCFEGFVAWNSMWAVRLGDPDEVRVARDVLSKHAHHGFKEGVLDVHVCASIHTRDSFEAITQERITGPHKRLHGDPITCQVMLAI